MSQSSPNISKQAWSTDPEQIARSARTFSDTPSSSAMFSLPESWDAEQLAVYVFVLSENRRKASDSKYLEVKQTQA